MWVEFGDGSLPRVERLFFLSISIVYKHQHFQIPIRPGMVDEQPLLEFVIAKSLFIYLFIYLFTYLLPCRLYQDGTKGGTIQA